MEKPTNIHHHVEHKHTLLGELMCHFPYAVFSVAFSLAILSLINYFSDGSSSVASACSGHGHAHHHHAHGGADALFHSFHFMHIVFAATGTLITFLRFSKNYVKAAVVGIISTSIFCMISDVIFPYIGGELLGVDMELHICFAYELPNVLPFLFIGVINGFIMSQHHEGKQSTYSLTSHAVHILISSLASMFYLVSHGFTAWQQNIGMVFLLLIGAVVVPCTLSDVVVPMMFAKADKKNEKHSN